MSRWLAAALAYGVVSALLRAVVHMAFGGSSTDYLLGVALSSLPGSVTGACVALPFVALWGRREGAGLPRWITGSWLMLAAIGLAGVAMAADYHRVFITLPDAGVFHYVVEPIVWSSFNASFPLWRLALEVGASLALLLVLQRWLERQMDARRVPGRAVGGAIVALGVVSLWVPAPASQFTVGRSDPWIWVVTTEQVAVLDGWASQGAPGEPGGPEDALQRLAVALDWAPDLALRGATPFCRDSAATTHHLPAGDPERSVIMLVFEGLTSRELQLEAGGRPVLPNIRSAFAASAQFERFFASAAQTSSVLESHYAGQPPNPHRIMLQHPPLPALEGFVSEFSSAGFATLYAHGASLAFENKRPFLERVGFDILLEPAVDARFDRGTWGEHDVVTYGRLQRWIAERPADATPYFAAMTTLSTHHPYVVPADAPRLLEGESEWVRFVNAYHYMDLAFAEFLAWFERVEQPRGTLLVLLGEHVPRMTYPGDPVRTTTGMFEFHFEIPFGILGLRPDELARVQARAQVAGSHPDIGPTVLGLAGLPPPPCGVGRDLLSVDDPPRADRPVVSHAGHRPFFLYLHEAPNAQGQTLRWMWDYRTRTLQAYDNRSDSLLEHDLAPGNPRREAILALVRDYTVALAHVDSLGARAPLDPRRAGQALRPAVEMPPWPPRLFASLNPHRPGVSLGHGVRAWLQEQEAAVHLELRVSPSADGELILSGNARVSGGQGDDWISRFELAQLQAMVDVEVTSLSAVLKSAPPGSAILVHLVPQPDVHAELGFGALWVRHGELASQQEVALSLRTGSSTVLAAVSRLPEQELFWDAAAMETAELDREAALELEMQRASEGGATGMVLPATLRPDQAVALRAAGLQLIIDLGGEEDPQRVRPLAPAAVIMSP